MSSTQSAHSTSSSTDLFATHLAKSTQSAKTAQPKTPPKGPRSRNKSDSADPTVKSATAKSSKPSQAKTSNPSVGQDGSAADDSTSTPQERAVATRSTTASSAANGSSKSRAASARSSDAKTNAAQRTLPDGTDTQSSASTADPSAETANSSGLSLLQLLAQSSGTSQVSSPPAADETAPEATASDSKDDSSPTTDPNALALAMLSQAFAANFSGAAATPATPASATPAAQDQAANASANSASSIAGVTDGSAGSSGTSVQQLVSLLGQDLAAEAKGKSDADAAAAIKSSSDNTDATSNGTMPDGATPTADSIAQSVAQLGAASHFPRDAVPNGTGEIKSPVGSPAWTQELGGHLTWMTHRGLESGSLRVSPEHLGPVEVQITVQNGDASVWFGANHPDTRAALEQALPKLREMFANQGLTLTDSGVSREPPRNQPRPAAPQTLAVSAIGSSEVTTTSVARASLGLIDTYA